MKEEWHGVCTVFVFKLIFFDLVHVYTPMCPSQVNISARTCACSSLLNESAMLAFIAINPSTVFQEMSLHSDRRCLCHDKK